VTVEFLDVEDVIEIHALQLAEFGGMPGLRDRALLESAVAQPQASAFGELIHADAIAMAAAYLFHIVRNHPFADGNKRAGLLAALVFLDLNGYAVPDEAPQLYQLTLGVADGSLSKEVVDETLRRLARPSDASAH
jgi:death-on-curing protein